MSTLVVEVVTVGACFLQKTIDYSNETTLSCQN